MFLISYILSYVLKLKEATIRFKGWKKLLENMAKKWKASLDTIKIFWGTV